MVVDSLLISRGVHENNQPHGHVVNRLVRMYKRSGKSKAYRRYQLFTAKGFFAHTNVVCVSSP